ncbi:MAG: exodeoxyribonuclease V subunit gamma [Flavobacteriales bacterium]|nr:exodeoxyribonuclease V subunit gamma [Flavobacteriales bacterium]
MGLKIYASSSVELLAKKLADSVKEEQQIFVPEYIVAAGAGVNNWLKIFLAEENGIAANLVFKKQDDLMRMVYKVLYKDDRKELMDQEYVKWKIYQVLGSQEFSVTNPNTFKYYGEDSLKRYGLSDKLALLFQNYQYHIPNEMEEDGDWQNDVWRQSMNAENEFIGLHEINELITTALLDEEKKKKLGDVLPHIHVYLGMDFTLFHLMVYQLISEVVNIRFYLFDGLLDGASASNPLVNNWNKASEIALEWIRELGEIEYLVPASLVLDSLLHKFQNDLFLNQIDSSAYTQNDIVDGSIVINSCYTEVREVEVLCNFLIKTISESNGEIGARDILVVTSDVDKYAPAIHGVFGSKKVKLPYSISDAVHTSSESVYATLLSLLNVNERFKAEEIVQLLELPLIRDQFKIEDVSFIRHMLKTANIRCGDTGSADNETNFVSWKHGLNRLVYGFCMGDESYFEKHGARYLLVDQAEGSNYADLMRLNSFFNKIEVLILSRQGTKTLSGWYDYFIVLVELFIHDPNGEHLGYFCEQLGSLNIYSEVVQDEVTFSVFKGYIEELIGSETNRSNYASKGITFCGMHQNRNVPYKVVCMLGVNLNGFLAENAEIHFNLLKDREYYLTSKEKDKFLFFQTILSCKDRLYISYIGKSTKDNSEIPPASVLDELIDYLEVNTGVELVQEHPLHGHSSDYLDPQIPELYSYLLSEPAPVQAVGLGGTQPIDVTEIDLDDLIKVFQDPAKEYLNKVLGIYYGEESEVIGDTELFEQDNLQNWLVKNEFIYQDADLEAWRLKLSEVGMIQLASLGELSLESEIESISEVKSTFTQAKLLGELEMKTGQLIFGDVLLKGRVDHVYGSTGIYNVVSSENRHAKYLAAFYIKWLFLKATGQNLKFIFNGLKRNIELEVNDGPTTEQALKQLNALVELYKTGVNEPLGYTIQLPLNELIVLGKSGSGEYEEAYLRSKILKHVNNEKAFPSKYYEMLVTENYLENENYVTATLTNTRALWKEIVKWLKL